MGNKITYKSDEYQHDYDTVKTNILKGNKLVTNLNLELSVNIPNMYKISNISPIEILEKCLRLQKSNDSEIYIKYGKSMANRKQRRVLSCSDLKAFKALSTQ